MLFSTIAEFLCIPTYTVSSPFPTSSLAFVTIFFYISTSNWSKIFWFLFAFHPWLGIYFFISLLDICILSRERSIQILYPYFNFLTFKNFTQEEERYRNIPSSGSFPKAYSHQSPRAGNSVQIFHMGVRDSLIWALPCCIPRMDAGKSEPELGV